MIFLKKSLRSLFDGNYIKIYMQWEHNHMQLHKNTIVTVKIFFINITTIPLKVLITVETISISIKRLSFVRGSLRSISLKETTLK